MDYGYKVTTHGRALLAKCLDLGKPLKLVRAAVGSGMMDADEDMAKMHSLIHYAAPAAIADRRHEVDRLYLTLQYSNQDHPEVGAFTLSEIMVWAEDPETGQETDYLYATLGDYRQPVPAYSSGFPASVWAFPLVLVVSGDLKVEITASPGLVTSLDLQEAIDRLTHAIMVNELTLPLATAGGEPMLTASGTPILAVYHPDRSTGILTAMAAMSAALEAVPGQIDAAQAAAVSAADRRIRAAMATHDADGDAHPTHLAIITN